MPCSAYSLREVLDVAEIHPFYSTSKYPPSEAVLREISDKASSNSEEADLSKQPLSRKPDLCVNLVIFWTKSDGVLGIRLLRDSSTTLVLKTHIATMSTQALLEVETVTSHCSLGQTLSKTEDTEPNLESSSGMWGSFSEETGS